ncbi:MAG: 50S ribosomal protein L6 [Alphaproteobacteria bacterium]|nr:MAG: 50S ribosomal protein L6 [Alphaproteobacteria bacterium]
MSRVGKNPVIIPESVRCTLAGNLLTVIGKFGELTVSLVDELLVEHKNQQILVSPKKKDRKSLSLWGTYRSLIANAVSDVDQGYVKRLEINGVGYRAALKGNDLSMQLGYSHDVVVPIPEGITVVCEKPTLLTITGFNRQQTGEFAAKVRSFRLPEPYKGKGIKYANEHIVRKEGKKK